MNLAAGNGERVVGARVRLEADMSHAGMSPVFGEAKEITPGQYCGTLDLTMRGDWVVLFHITLSSGKKIERQMKIQNLQAA